MTISPNVHILTDRDLDEIKNKSFQRGVERGRFEERAAAGKERVAQHCFNWHHGKCEVCGVQWQDFEVDALHKCSRFVAR